jgi:hypothetical protein
MLSDMRCGPSVMVRSGDAKLVKYDSFESPECDPDATALKLERYIPTGWSGPDLDQQIRLQQERSELIHRWVGASPVDAYPESASEVVDHWQVDVSHVSLEN